MADMTLTVECENCGDEPMWVPVYHGEYVHVDGCGCGDENLIVKVECEDCQAHALVDMAQSGDVVKAPAHECGETED